MGRFGSKILENDCALDASDFLVECLKKKIAMDDIEEYVFEEYTKSDDDTIQFWLGFAVTAWKYGRLTKKTRNKAVEIIESGADLSWWSENNPDQYAARKKELEKCREKLLSQQPAKKEISVPKPYKCEWNIGDTYAYKMETDFAKETGYYGRYVIVRKAGEIDWIDDKIIPIVYLKITEDEYLPKTIEEYNKLPYVINTRRKDLSLAVTVDFQRLKTEGEGYLDEIAAIKQSFGPPDQNGNYFSYKVKLENSSKRIIPKNLIFLGNFTGVRNPQYELDNGSYYLMQWKSIVDDTIIRYEHLNLNKQDLRQYYIHKYLVKKK